MFQISKKINIFVVDMLLLAMLALGFDAQAASADNAQAKPTADAKSSRIDIASVNGKPAQPQTSIVFEELDEGGEFDVEIAGYNIKGDDKIWLLAKSLDEQNYYAFGPAQKQSMGPRGSWLVPHVVLPHQASTQQKYFFLRAAIEPPDLKSPTDTLDSSTTLSPSVSVVVQKWNPNPHELAIDSIDGQAVTPQQELAVKSTVSLSGKKPKDKNEDVYLIVHPQNSDTWRVLGPAEIKEDKWYMRDAPLAEPNQAHWRNMDIFAIQSKEKLNPGPIAYHAYWEKALSASHSIHVWVKDDMLSLPREVPSATIESYTASDKEEKRIDNIKIPYGTREISISGNLKNLPGGKSLWAAIRPANSSSWIVQGPAKMFEYENAEKEKINKWSLSQVRLESLEHPDAVHYHLMMVVGDESQLQAGIFDYNTLLNRATVASELLSVSIAPKPNTKQEPTPAQVESAPALQPKLSIIHVDGQTVDSDDEINLLNTGAVTVDVSASELPQSAHVWIGKSQVDGDSWNFSAASRTADDTWTNLAINFSQDKPPQADAKTDPTAEKPDKLVAIATLSSLPVTQGNFDWWRSRAIAISPVVKITHASLMTSTVTWTGGIFMLPLFWMIVALSLVAAALEYFFRLPSLVAGEIKSAGEASLAYVRSQFFSLPKINCIHAAFGIFLLYIGIYAIIGYFPIYEHVLQITLKLPRQQSHSLALLLILFTGLTGVLGDVTMRFSHSDQTQATESDYSSPTTLSNVCFFIIVSILFIGVALLFFQFTIYRYFGGGFN